MGNRDQILNDNEASLRLAFEGIQSNIWTAIPGTVDSVNLTKMTISVQPTIKGINQLQDGTTEDVELPLLLDVPICFPSAGGFTLTFPVAVDDEVLVIFASRCIDSWWQQGGVQPQAEMRMHDLSDGFAILAPFSQPNVITGISSSKAQLRSNDGTLYLELTDDGKMNLVAPSGVKITGDLTVDGDIMTTGDLETDGNIHCTSDLTVDGTTHSTGDISTDGDVSANGDVTAGSISLKNHTHAAGTLMVTSAPGPVTGSTGAAS